MDFVPVEELQKVLSYTDSTIQANCIRFYKANGCSLGLLADHLRAIEKLGNEALAIDDSDEVAELWHGFDQRPLLKADVHLRESLSVDYPDYCGWFTGTWAFGAKQFVHHCRRLQQKLSTVGVEILNPADELRSLNAKSSVEDLFTVVERNLERRTKKSFDGASFRHGLLLGLAFSKHSLNQEESSRLQAIVNSATYDNEQLGKPRRNKR